MLNINGAFTFPTTDGTDAQVLMTDGNGLLNWTDIPTGTLLADEDNDTKIQVEESSDENIIRFDLGGTEFMRLDSGRIEILNTGNSVFIGEGAGQTMISQTIEMSILAIKLVIPTLLVLITSSLVIMLVQRNGKRQTVYR